MTTQLDHKPPKASVGYLGIDITKVPNWHGLVTLDLLFNNLATGMYLAATPGELASPGLVGPVAKLAYPIALLFLTIDLACLVLDLGHKTRFHHMLRVFKPTSPMSLGTWSLTAYSLPLTAIVAVDLLGWLGWVNPSTDAVGFARKVILVLGLLPAFGSALYKGVLFSTSSQPGWKDARWFGAYLVNSALLYGTAGLCVLALATGRPAAPFRGATAILVASNLLMLILLALELRSTLARVLGKAGVARLMAVAGGVGSIVPMALLLLSESLPGVLAALVCVILGGLAWRHALVMLPHESKHLSSNPAA